VTPHLYLARRATRSYASAGAPRRATAGHRAGHRACSPKSLSQEPLVTAQRALEPLARIVAPAAEVTAAITVTLVRARAQAATRCARLTRRAVRVARACRAVRVARACRAVRVARACRASGLAGVTRRAGSCGIRFASDFASRLPSARARDQHAPQQAHDARSAPPLDAHAHRGSSKQRKAPDPIDVAGFDCVCKPEANAPIPANPARRDFPPALAPDRRVRCVARRRQWRRHRRRQICKTTSPCVQRIGYDATRR
jgi:hypothetical protein